MATPTGGGRAWEEPRAAQPGRLSEPSAPRDEPCGFAAGLGSFSPRQLPHLTPGSLRRSVHLSFSAFSTIDKRTARTLPSDSRGRGPRQDCPERG